MAGERMIIKNTDVGAEVAKSILKRLRRCSVRASVAGYTISARHARTLDSASQIHSFSFFSQAHANVEAISLKVKEPCDDFLVLLEENVEGDRELHPFGILSVFRTTRILT